MNYMNHIFNYVAWFALAMFLMTLAVFYDRNPPTGRHGAVA